MLDTIKTYLMGGLLVALTVLLGVASWLAYERGNTIDTQKTTINSLTVDRDSLKKTLALKNSTDTITEQVNVALQTTLQTHSNQVDAIQSDLDQKIQAIENGYQAIAITPTTVPNTSTSNTTIPTAKPAIVIPKDIPGVTDQDSQISQARISSLWQTFCLTEPCQ